MRHAHLWFVVVCFVGLVWLAMPHSSHESPGEFADPLAAQSAEVDAVVKGWLEAQRKGQSGEEFWLKENFVRPISLYAVSSYEVVDAPCCGKRVVRINSATRGGQPITRLYTIVVVRGRILEVRTQGKD